MGVGIHLAGRFRKRGLLSRTPPPDKCLDAMEQYFRREAGGLWHSSHREKTPDGKTALAVSLHPAAEAIEITASDGGRVALAAKTSTVGPGYHAFLCDALRKAGTELNIDWDKPDPAAAAGDPSGYVDTGDFAAVRKEMLGWLGNAARQMLELAAQGYSGLALSMPVEVAFHHDGAIATAMGPRSEQWLREVADAPARGTDVFPWWDKGTGPGYHLGRALARMWTDVRWRPPQAEAGRLVIDDVLRYLAAAYAADPSLDYPWREWHELNGYAGAAGPLADAVAARASENESSEAPRVGYRRRDVTARLAGEWSITVPGSFDAVTNEDSWQAYDETRVVYVSSLSVKGRSGEPAPAEELLAGFANPEGNVLETFDHRGPRVVGKAAITRALESGRTVLRLQGASAVPGGVGIVTIDLYDPSHRQWAIDAWKSLDHPVG